MGFLGQSCDQRLAAYLFICFPLLQVAAELQSADELVLSELVFDGTFTDANAEQVVALLASVVWREHGAEDSGASKLPEELKPVLTALHAAAHRVAKVIAYGLAASV